MSRFGFKDGRYWKDGAPFFVIGVEYQYYRDRRDRWAARLRQLRAAHANVVTFYVPWRHHLVSDSPGGPRPLPVAQQRGPRREDEPRGAPPPGTSGGMARPQRFDFGGETRENRDLAGFLGMCAEAGLYAIAKPGPFVHSELNIGGLPDLASPSHDPAIAACRKHDGSPLRWGYDDALLPSPGDPTFDALARDWLAAAGVALRPFAAPAGPLIGIQLNDETLYCTSNAPPWDFGYEARPGPARPLPERPIATEEDARALVAWADYQWRVRHDAYARYKGYLGLESLPHLTNYAGITPPIEENIPGKEGTAEIAAPRDDFARLYADWWLAMNRIEADLPVCEYGMVSWLGVAAYGIPNPRETDRDRGTADNPVFARYINTARRRRGINMEENWGFATLYHPWSKLPVIPFFQTTASVAGGATGYVVFTGVSHDHWDDDLDRVTRRQHPWFPSDAPIRPDGTETPLYATLALLNGWLAREGGDFLRAELPADVTWLAYPPYAAISGWVPDARYWRLPHPIPRSGVDAGEPLSFALQREGYVLDMIDVTAVPLEELLRRPVCAFRTGFFLDDETAAKLRAYEARGGTLVRCGDDAPGDVLRALAATGRAPRWRATPGLRAFVYEAPSTGLGAGPSAGLGAGGDDRWVFFFGFERTAGPHPHRIEIRGGPALELALGAKTAGVVHLRGERIVSAMAKGRNELEGTETEIAIRCGRDEVRGRGDFAVFP